MLNCTVTENNADRVAGGLYVQGPCGITNSILWRNRDNASPTNIESAQVFAFNSAPALANSILEGLSSYAGNSNLSFDPLFVNSGATNFTLQTASPAIDAGANSAVSASVDLAGLARINGSRVDMGAYEATNSTAPVFLTVTPQSQGICVGNSAVFSVVGTNGAGAGVQWQVNMGSGFVAIPSDGHHQIIVSSNASTLVVSNALLSMNNWQYKFSIPAASYAASAVTLSVTPRTVIYVDAAAAGNGTGTNWANAFTNLASAVVAANACSQIWVAQGTNQVSMVSLIPGVQIYGGFNKTETNVNSRNWSNNVTILQGSTQAIIYNANSGVQRDALLDGFTLQGANGSSAAVFNFQSSPTIRNCRFQSNQGGGIDNVQGSPWIESCQFSGNGLVAIGKTENTIS